MLAEVASALVSKFREVRATPEAALQLSAMQPRAPNVVWTQSSG